MDLETINAEIKQLDSNIRVLKGAIAEYECDIERNQMKKTKLEDKKIILEMPCSDFSNLDKDMYYKVLSTAMCCSTNVMKEIVKLGFDVNAHDHSIFDYLSFNCFCEYDEEALESLSLNPDFDISYNENAFLKGLREHNEDLIPNVLNHPKFEISYEFLLDLYDSFSDNYYNQHCVKWSIKNMWLYERFFTKEFKDYLKLWIPVLIRRCEKVCECKCECERQEWCQECCDCHSEEEMNYLKHLMSL